MSNTISSGGDSNNSINVIGDRNRLTVTTNSEGFEPTKCLDALYNSLGEFNLDSKSAQKADNALSDAKIETQDEKPNKAEIGGALERWIGYVKGATNYTEKIDSLKPHISGLATWLGSSWSKLNELI